MTTAVLNTKNDAVENKVPGTSGLVTTGFLTTKIGEFENNRTIYYDAKISDIEWKYFSTFDYNKFTNDIRDAKRKQKKLANVSNISNLVKSSNLSTKFETLTTKSELKAEQDKIK